MRKKYASGMVDKSTIFHLLATYNETGVPDAVNQSLCGRMKGDVTKINERQATCYSCLEIAKRRAQT